VTDSKSFSFQRSPKSVPTARAALAQFQDSLPASAMYDASLCLSELVTNAVQHPGDQAGDELELRLTLSDAALRVDVVDPGDGFQPGEPTAGNDRGWGLFIVDRLASRWGSEPSEGRTLIWFEIDRAETGASGAAADDRESPPGDADEARRDEVANAVARLKLKPAIQ
jgi:anti-sigma regulatory factor (Ser/Thr protein kinase)